MARMSRKDLEQRLEWVNREIQQTNDRHQTRLGEVSEEIGRYRSFLADLLLLEPGLDKYRAKADNSWALEEGNWDFDGVRRAVNFREEEANAARYIAPEKPHQAQKPDPEPIRFGDLFQQLIAAGRASAENAERERDCE